MRELNSLEIDEVSGAASAGDVAAGIGAIAGAVVLVATAPVSMPILAAAAAIAFTGGYLLAG